MASGLKLIKYPKIRLGIAADTSKTLTIQCYPKVELVIIALAPSAGGGDDCPKFQISGFWNWQF